MSGGSCGIRTSGGGASSGGEQLGTQSLGETSQACLYFTGVWDEIYQIISIIKYW